MREALLVFILGFSAVLSGCGGNGSNTASNAPVLTSISVTAPSANIIVNQTEQMTATGTYSDHTTKDLTSSASRSSSNRSLATVAQGGMLTAKSSGTVSITATLNSIIGSFNLTI